MAGAAGMGKTQACLTLCVVASLPLALHYMSTMNDHDTNDIKHINASSMARGIVYIDTERTFSATRYYIILIDIIYHMLT